MPEGGLKRDIVQALLHSLCAMTLPQLLWMNMKTGGSSPLSANISNHLSSEMSRATGARKYIAVSFAAAMVHKVEVHHHSYRTSEWRSVRKAFAEAS